MEEELSRKIHKALSILENDSEAFQLTNAIQELAGALQDRPADDGWLPRWLAGNRHVQLTFPACSADKCRRVLVDHDPPVERLLMQAMDEQQGDLELQQVGTVVAFTFFFWMGGCKTLLLSYGSCWVNLLVWKVVFTSDPVVSTEVFFRHSRDLSRMYCTYSTGPGSHGCSG